MANTIMLVVWRFWQSCFVWEIFNSQNMNRKWNMCFLFFDEASYFSWAGDLFIALLKWFCVSDGERERSLALNGKNCRSWQAFQRMVFVSNGRSSYGSATTVHTQQLDHSVTQSQKEDKWKSFPNSSIFIRSPLRTFQFSYLPLTVS